MEITRAKVKNKLRPMFEKAKEEPVFITNYGKIENVVISKKLYDEWKEIVEKVKKE